PKGTGDLFCASLTGHWLGGLGLAEAAVQACCHVVQALRRTEQAQCAELLLPMAGNRSSDKTTTRECVSKSTYRIFPCKQPLPICCAPMPASRFPSCAARARGLPAIPSSGCCRHWS